MSYRVDLHTHSVTSPDGSLTLAHYQRALDKGLLDYIAITDHNTVAFALKAQAALGDRIIVGEEVTTKEGEIIGLYLTETVPKGLSLADSVAHIKQQGGLVYVPHPFETVRKGLTDRALTTIRDQIDIVEIYNGRAVFQNRHELAEAWASSHELPGAAGSDAHGWYGWAKTYSTLDTVPTKNNLVALLHAARRTTHSPGLFALLYPKVNRMRKVLHI
jgi:predicted metal-dependent phosphoesterase TrpH